MCLFRVEAASIGSPSMGQARFVAATICIGAPVLVAQTIPGFSSALQRMQPGGQYKIHIPAKLAYGATPPPGSPIPANSDLDFDIHVLQVVPNAALMAGPGGPGGPQQQPQPQR